MSKRNRSGAEQKRARKRRLEREAIEARSARPSELTYSTRSDPQPRKQR
ncbi:hypothetical protein [Dietzia sp. WMMA184]|nr:hypothetical protein [Dietzia sp. WMMA184]